jgi:hypothetical protein
MEPEDVGVKEVDEPTTQDAVLFDVLRQKLKPPLLEGEA